MNINTLNKLINQAYGYKLYLQMGIFILFLAIALIAMQMAGVMSGEDEEIMRIMTVGITISSVVIIGISLFLVTKKRNYSKLLKITEEEFAEIMEDTNNLELTTATFALGSKYACFYGQLKRNKSRFMWVKYEEIAYAKFSKWRSNEQILFYDDNDEWIATIGGYKKRSQTIKNILLASGISVLADKS